MQKITTLLLLTAFSNLLSGQTNYEKFKQLYKDHDTAKIKALLATWENADPDDPELYTAAFNFYFQNSQQETISIDQQQHSKEGFQLTDSTGAVAGFMGSSVYYNREELDKGFKYINKGIEKFPNRLDIRFGKSYALGEVEDYENFTTEIISAVEYSVSIKNDWLWTENKKLDDAQNFMLSAIQEYLKQLYDTGDDSLLENMKRIGDVTLRYYPNSIEILSTTAVAYMLTKNYDKAITYLLQAEKLNPEDHIVLNNIAHGYKLKGDKQNAIKYYKLAEKYGDEETKSLARKGLEELQQ